MTRPPDPKPVLRVPAEMPRAVDLLLIAKSARDQLRRCAAELACIGNTDADNDWIVEAVYNAEDPTAGLCALGWRAAPPDPDRMRRP